MSSDSVSARFPEVLDFRLRLRALFEQAGQSQDRVHRRSELVRHVRQEPRFQLVCAPEMVGAFVELGVERDDAAVGVFQLAVQPHEHFLPPVELLQRAQEFLVLPLEFLDQPGRLAIDDGACDFIESLRVHEWRAARQESLQVYGRAVPPRLDLEPIHQPPGAREPDAHSGRRPVSPREHVVEVANSGAGIADDDREQLRLGASFDDVIDPSGSGVPERVADDFGDRSRHTRLLGLVEAQQGSELSGSLAGGDDVLFVLNDEGEEGLRQKADSSEPASECPRCVPHETRPWLSCRPPLPGLGRTDPRRGRPAEGADMMVTLSRDAQGLLNRYLLQVRASYVQPAIIALFGWPIALVVVATDDSPAIRAWTSGAASRTVGGQPRHHRHARSRRLVDGAGPPLAT